MTNREHAHPVGGNSREHSFGPTDGENRYTDRTSSADDLLEPVEQPDKLWCQPAELGIERRLCGSVAKAIGQAPDGGDRESE